MCKKKDANTFYSSLKKKKCYYFIKLLKKKQKVLVIFKKKLYNRYVYTEMISAEWCFSYRFNQPSYTDGKGDLNEKDFHIGNLACYYYDFVLRYRLYDYAGFNIEAGRI